MFLLSEFYFTAIYPFNCHINSSKDSSGAGGSMKSHFFLLLYWKEIRRLGNCISAVVKQKCCHKPAQQIPRHCSHQGQALYLQEICTRCSRRTVCPSQGHAKLYSGFPVTLGAHTRHSCLQAMLQLNFKAHSLSIRGQAGYSTCIYLCAFLLSLT